MGLMFAWRRFLFLWRVGFCFPAALTPIRASHRSESSNMIDTIRWKRNLRWPNLGRRRRTITFFRLGSGHASRSKVGLSYFIVSLGIYASTADTSFLLFPSYH